MSSFQRFSCFDDEVVRQIKSSGFRLNCGWMTLHETHGPQNHGDKITQKDNQFECVSFATGTRAIPDERVDSLNPGCGLADCHAEVLCRRAFLRFCLDQMNELKNGRESKIFEKSMSEEGKFEIKPDVKVHFYTSSLPRGDCQIHQMIIDQSESRLSISQSEGFKNWP